MSTRFNVVAQLDLDVAQAQERLNELVRDRALRLAISSGDAGRERIERARTEVNRLRTDRVFERLAERGQEGEHRRGMYLFGVRARSNQLEERERERRERYLTSLRLNSARMAEREQERSRRAEAGRLRAIERQNRQETQGTGRTRVDEEEDFLENIFSRLSGGRNRSFLPFLGRLFNTEERYRGAGPNPFNTLRDPDRFGSAIGNATRTAVASSVRRTVLRFAGGVVAATTAAIAFSRAVAGASLSLNTLAARNFRVAMTRLRYQATLVASAFGDVVLRAITPLINGVQQFLALLNRLGIGPQTSGLAPSGRAPQDLTPQFHGGGRVRRSGVAELQAGEEVLSRSDQERAFNPATLPIMMKDAIFAAISEAARGGVLDSLFNRTHLPSLFPELVEIAAPLPLPVTLDPPIVAGGTTVAGGPRTPLVGLGQTEYNALVSAMQTAPSTIYAILSTTDGLWADLVSTPVPTTDGAWADLVSTA